MKRTLALAAMLASAAAATVPLVALADTRVSIVVGSAPPPARFESVPVARHGHVWSPGYWNWDGHRYQWVSGHWESVRHGHRYMEPRWVRDDHGWRLVRGGWEPATAYREVRIAPPAPLYEPVPYPRMGYIWVPGYWDWSGSRYVWVRGSFMPERAGFVYRQPAWVHHNGGWVMEPGRWHQHGGYVYRDHGYERRHDRDRDHHDRDRRDRYERDHHNGFVQYSSPRNVVAQRDRDRDGIPDSLDRKVGKRQGDRDRDHDGVPNRRDRDRDGDGVPNRVDASPNDHHRR